MPARSRTRRCNADGANAGHAPLPAIHHRPRCGCRSVSIPPHRAPRSASRRAARRSGGPARSRPAAPARRRARTGADAAASGRARRARDRRRPAGRCRCGRGPQRRSRARSRPSARSTSSARVSSARGAASVATAIAQIDERRLVGHAPGRRAIVGRARGQLSRPCRRRSARPPGQRRAHVADIAAEPDQRLSHVIAQPGSPPRRAAPARSRPRRGRARCRRRRAPPARCRRSSRRCAGAASTGETRVDEALARQADQQRQAERAQLAEPRDHRDALLRRLAEADAGIEHDAVAARCRRVAAISSERAKNALHVRHDVERGIDRRRGCASRSPARRARRRRAPCRDRAAGPRRR